MSIYACGNFTISNNIIARLSNLATLTFTTENPTYVNKSSEVGFNFPKSGIYSIQINFNIARHDQNGDFNVKVFLSQNSSNIPPYPLNYDQISQKVSGPSLLEYKGICFCPSRTVSGGVPSFDRSQQFAQGDTGGYKSPLVMFNYYCKTDLNINCYSNYNTTSYIINVSDIEVTATYFIQTAFDSGGTYMTGSGNFYITYLGE